MVEDDYIENIHKKKIHQKIFWSINKLSATLHTITISLRIG